ncbi:hypothetical protein ILUMI_10670 [Ignelater luminosus]|uniref:MD-2-related lipid-recognition domain-containing protein n=1 Tax=Ignelater luminosus TaxID=2038154 RepID=A0A8K0D3H1_IGNLU|nr:hypothetical protein ILUMI_10670 [Ignelater luminosus]
MKKLGSCLLLFIAAFTFVNATHSDCGSELGTIVSVDISECKDEDPRCVLHRNTNTTFKLTFNLKENVEKVKAVVHGVVLDVPVPFNLPNSDGCVDSGLKCPLQAGQDYTYETSLPVLKKYPRVTVDVKWELQNENDKDIVCIMIPSKIQ